MSKPGPILLIEDDPDDQDLMKEVMLEMNIPNDLVFFTNGIDAFEYLKNSDEQQFLIISDVNLPKMTGIDFKRKIDADPELRRKSIPFVFLSTTADRQSVNKAYTEMAVQGFFQKVASFEELKRLIRLLIDYWMICKHPNML